MKQLEHPWFLSVQMDVDPSHESLFHEVYETEHIPALLEVPGVRSVRRFRRNEELRIALGGEVQTLSFPAEPGFTALYELADPEIILGSQWAKAVEAGRWSSLVRPFTSNRRHTIHSTVSWKTKS
ncbi:hypothetical protein J2857_002846 [Neorhizobium galegae]|uniref:DUF4286 family protein n=1 Tax=Neorhizobium galegae TaxID=399 RepID=UPI001AE6446F|nr:DUF4286 family protein [Neorhizobium galegae]MBP2560077.1 hypothetical protein [Neorhizobium galegae]